MIAVAVMAAGYSGGVTSCGGWSWQLVGVATLQKLELLR